MEPGRRRAAGRGRPGTPRPPAGRLRPVVLLLPLLVPAGAWSQRSGETLVDRVAVVVEGLSARDREAQLATVWDLFVAANVAIVRRAGPEAFAVPADVAAFLEAQHLAVERLVALREAVRLGRDAVGPDLVDDARDALAARIGSQDTLHAFLRERAISLEALNAELRREVIVDRFTRDSVRLPTALDATELAERFAAGGHPFAGRPFEEAAAEYESWLRAAEFGRYRELWLMDLRSRCRVAVFDVGDDLLPPETGAGSR